MTHTARSLRGISLLVFVTLVSQIIFPLIQVSYALNATYYVSFGDGNDTNDGSAGNPWQTLSPVNSTSFGAGDKILFKCGDEWAETLILKDSGVSGNPIVYGSYGTCDGSNDPIITGNAGVTISELVSVSHVTLENITSSGGLVELIATASTATGILMQNMNFSHSGNICLSQDSEKELTLSGNIFNDCHSAVSLGAGGSVSVNNSTFTNIGTGSAIISTGSTLSISNNAFTNILGNAITFTSNSTISQNTFTNICSAGADCAAITHVSGATTGVSISQNTIIGVGSGIAAGGYQDGIRLEQDADGINISDNTISNAQTSLHLVGAKNTFVSGNTFFNPRTEAIVIEEKIADTVVNNTISSNTLLTYNPSYSMVKVYDMVDASGALADFGNNRYINIYKSKLPVIDILTTGGTSYSLDKDNLTTIEPSATNFTYFGYKAYTSTGSYSGASLITNGTFTSDISGWTADNVTLSHDGTGGTLQASQGLSSTGVISSNNFSLVSGAVYEVSGIVKHIAGTNTGSHIKLHVRQDAAPSTLYADRVIDVVATASGKTFSTYITANATVSDARLDLELSNPSTDIELDLLVVRRVTGLTANPRINEARLMVNTGSIDADYSCPGGGGCPLQYRDLDDIEVVFPTTIPAFSSKIILWRDPGSSFTPANILHRPTGSFVPSAGSVPNNTPIDFTWASSEALEARLLGSTMTGAFDYIVPQSGTATMFPPSDGTTTYSLHLTNDIGMMIYTADVVTSNTPPVTDPIFVSGLEEALSITGIVTATDINSGGSLTYSLFELPNPSQGSLVDSNLDGTLVDPDGSFDFVPTSQFCGNATFTFLARDSFGLVSDALNPGVVTVNVICTNDDPVAVDDGSVGSGLTTIAGISNILDVVANDTDIDSTYDFVTPQTFTPVAFSTPGHGSVTISGSTLDYVPDIAYVGSDSFTYSMMDQSGGLSSTGTVYVTVYPGSNLAPTAHSGSASVVEDTPYTGTLSGSDQNYGDTITFATGSSPVHGTVTLSGSEYTYTPNANYNGTDSFTFHATDSGGLTSADVIVDITVTGMPDIPVVTDTTITVEMGIDQTLALTGYYTDADEPYVPQNLTISGYSIPAHGTLTLVGENLVYHSDALYLGADQFTYNVVDVNGNISNTGTVDLTVSTTNTPPVAYSGTFVMDEDMPYIGTLSGFDVDATPLTFSIATLPTNGTLSPVSTGGFIYTPNLHYNGTDSFTFRVSDGVFTSTVETITLTINPINDVPTVVADTATGTEDNVLVLTNLLSNDLDVDAGDTLMLNSIATQGTKGTAVLSGTTDVTYTPIANACGADVFTYIIQDQSGALSSSGNVTINITCTNDAPVSSNSSLTTTGNVVTNSGISLIGAATATDIDAGDTLTYTLDTGVLHGSLTLGSTGGFVYTPNLGYTGSDSFSFSATDGMITTGTATVSITVIENTYNTVPTASSGSFTTSEDVPLIGTLTGFDLESAPLTFTVGSGVTHGTLVISSTGMFTYTPTANYNGSDSFTFRVSDGTFYSAYQTGSITVTSVNDLPTATSDVAVVTEDVPQLISAIANDTDIDGTVTSITGLVQPSTGGTLAIVGTGILLTPSLNFCSATPITYSYQAVDDVGGISPATISSFSVTCVNDLPVVSDDTASGAEDTAITIPVFANDSDVDVGDTLNVSSNSQPSTGGTLTIISGGFRFTPTANFCSASPVTFTYSARDTAGGVSNTGTVSVTVNCVNDVPTVGNVSYTMTGNIASGSTSTLMTSLSGSDVETSSLIFTIGASFSTGTTLLSSTGLLTYTPPAGFVGSLTATYSVDDGTTNSSPGTISICVVSPDSNVALPSCAVTGSTSSEKPGYVTGPGAGGGSYAMSTVGGMNPSGSSVSTIANTYTQAIGGNNISSELLTQLMFGRQSSSTSSSVNSVSNSSSSQQSTTPSISSLLDVITNVVEFSRDLGVSNPGIVRDIRHSGQKILKSVNTNSDMTPSEKADALRAAAKELKTYLDPKPEQREYNALKYVIRILSARESVLRTTVDALSEFDLLSDIFG